MKRFAVPNLGLIDKMDPSQDPRRSAVSATFPEPANGGPVTAADEFPAESRRPRSADAGVSSGADTIPRPTRRDRGGPTGNRPCCRPMTGPRLSGRQVAVSAMVVTSLLASVLVPAATSHLVRPVLGDLSEQIILVAASVAAMTCVIGSLLIHGCRIVFWLFLGGFFLCPIAQANDQPLSTTLGVAFFVGPLAWNNFLLVRSSDRGRTGPGSLRPSPD
jgi:hypothetical protein